MKTKILFILLVLAMALPLSGQLTQPEVTMLVNGKTRAEIPCGLPVVLKVSLSYFPGITLDEVLHGLPDSLKTDPAIIRRFDSIFSPLDIGHGTNQWFTHLFITIRRDDEPTLFSVPMKMIKSMPAETMMLHTEEAVHAIYGIDPEVTQTWAPESSYILKAGFIKAGLQDTVWSEKAAIKTTGRTIKRLQEMNSDELFFTGEYWLRRSDCIKAEPPVKLLYQEDSVQIRNLMLMAELEECKGNLGRAHTLYARVLDEAFKVQMDVPEPPVILMEKLRELQERMQGK